MVRFYRGVLGVVVLAGCLTDALVAGKPVADIPLLLGFSNTEADALTSDGFHAAGYPAADYANGIENVLAIIQPSGNFRFTTQNDLRAPAPRRMCVDFGSQFADKGLGVPFVDGDQRQCVNVMQPMHSYPTGDISIASLRYGQSVDKLTRLEWDDGSYRYRIGYGTDLDRNGVIDSPPVRVTCTAAPVSSTVCTTWVLAPSTDGTAVLYRFKIQKSGSVLEDQGVLVADVKMPFAQTFTRK